MENNSKMNLKKDDAIVYESKLIEVRQLIENAKNIGLNVSSIEKEVKKVEQRVSEAVSDDYSEEYNKSYSETALSFSHDSLSNTYQSAKKDLNNIIRVLNLEYNDYYKIAQICISVENSIKDTSNAETDINNVIDTTITALKEMRASTTIDYDIERNMVTRLYRVIYEIMKIELIYTDGRRLLDTIKKDETNSMFIVKLLEEELNAVNDDDANNIANMLRSNGMDPRLLLDEKLIKLVAILKKPNMLEEIETRYSLNREQLDKLNEELNEQQKQYSIKETEIKNEEEEYTDLKRRTRKAGFRAVFNALALALCLTGGYKLADKFGQAKEYYTNTNTYSTETGKTIPKEGYTRGEDDSVIIIEKTPWSSPGYFRDGKYERYIYKYKVPENNIGDYNKPEEFLTEDLRGIIECTSTEPETSQDIPEDFGYGQSQYTVIKQTKDLEKVNYTRNHLLFALILAGIAGSTLVVELIYLKKTADNKYSVLRKRKKTSL